MIDTLELHRDEAPGLLLDGIMMASMGREGVMSITRAGSKLDRTQSH